MNEHCLTCASEAEQMDLAGSLAREVGGHPAQVHLQGELGAGKTTFVRGFLRGLGFEGAVRSPTYTLVEPYAVEGRNLLHLDLYRLADPGELEYLGLREALDGDALVFVEWPERGEGWLPEPDLVLNLKHLKQGRELCFSARSPAGELWLRALQRIRDQGKT